jgi:hypothetical protein
LIHCFSVLIFVHFDRNSFGNHRSALCRVYWYCLRYDMQELGRNHLITDRELLCFIYRSCLYYICVHPNFKFPNFSIFRPWPHSCVEEVKFSTSLSITLQWYIEGVDVNFHALTIAIDRGVRFTLRQVYGAFKETGAPLEMKLYQVPCWSRYSLTHAENHDKNRSHILMELHTLPVCETNFSGKYIYWAKRVGVIWDNLLVKEKTLLFTQVTQDFYGSEIYKVILGQTPE